MDAGHELWMETAVERLRTQFDVQGWWWWEGGAGLCTQHTKWLVAVVEREVRGTSSQTMEWPEVEPGEGSSYAHQPIHAEGAGLALHTQHNTRTSNPRGGADTGGYPPSRQTTAPCGVAPHGPAAVRVGVDGPRQPLHRSLQSVQTVRGGLQDVPQARHKGVHLIGHLQAERPAGLGGTAKEGGVQSINQSSWMEKCACASL